MHSRHAQGYALLQYFHTGTKPAGPAGTRARLKAGHCTLAGHKVTPCSWQFHVVRQARRVSRKAVAADGQAMLTARRKGTPCSSPSHTVMGPAGSTGGGQPMPLARRCTPVKHNGKPCLSSVHAVTRARRVHGRAVAADGQATHNHVAQGYTLFAMSSHRVHSSVCAAYTGTRVKAGIRRLSMHVRSRCCTLDCLATAVIQTWQERLRAVAGRWPGDAPPDIRVNLVSREFTC